MLEQLQHEVRKFGTDAIKHFGRPLTAHLIETSRWLEKWGNSPDLIAAGAFHSIYGTEEFREKAVGLERRPEIQEIIGAEAERLVYLFCLADRSAFFAGQTSPPYSIPLPSTGACVDLDESTLAALLELETANIIDGALHQPDAPPSAGEFWMARFESVNSRLSKGAYRDVQETLTKWNPRDVRKRMLHEGWINCD